MIVGAGLGGLALAHGLRRRGIQALVFERNALAGDGLAGYGIHIDSRGWLGLGACLPADGTRQLETVAAAPVTRLSFRDERLNLLVGLGEGASGEAPRGVGPLALRDLMLRSLGDAPAPDARWNKEFVRYEDADGVTPCFADGTETRGDILVGADASRSRVRAQRLPGLDREDLGILTIAGRHPLGTDGADGLPACFVDCSLNNIAPSGRAWMFVSSWLLGDTASSRYPGENSDYVVWAFVAGRASYPADIDDLSPQALRDHVLARIERWAPDLRRLVRGSDPASVVRVPLPSMPHLRDWAPSRVTLIGDAIHNMTPLAGVGANTTFRDAAELSSRLAEAGTDPVAAIGRYEAAMRAYANPAVLLSRDNARRAARSSRTGRTAFRTVLRLAEAAPRSSA